MTRFKYYTIYRCRNCGEHIRVHGKLVSKLVLPEGTEMCCSRPRLTREREVLISEYEKEKLELPRKQDQPLGTKQKRLADFSKKKR
ncbi:MAG: hypothetical protein ACFFD8_04650 [Candidatus Thorarchaeota archaeon]